ncbi:MAG: glycoside hydrolase family 5 protein, partial [Duncaniella sp.]|nr:glycoside hydrolase family 5 protein [Duncaniella sp.]
MKSLPAIIVSAVALGMMAGCGHGAQQSANVENAENDTMAVIPLHVSGTALVNADGDTVVLNGPSLGWHSNWGRFYNEGTVRAVKEKWGANIVRAAIGAHPSGDCVNGYSVDSANAVNLAMKVIDAAIANQMYVICDWHSHENTLSDAKNFFSVITEKYGDTPNILYEIWNEPL